jgi:protein HOOK3
MKCWNRESLLKPWIYRFYSVPWHRSHSVLAYLFLTNVKWHCSAPRYFDASTIARHLGDNWALKQSNLRKLIRNLEHYYHAELHKEFNDGNWNQMLDINQISRHCDMEPLLLLCQLVMAAAVTCPEKHVYVQRILSMSPDSQVAMKGMIEQSMQYLSDFVDDSVDESHDGDADLEQDENELVFDDTAAGMSTPMSSSNDPARNALYPTQTRLFAASAQKGNLGDTDPAQQQLEETLRELASLKLQTTITAEESQRAEQKLSAMIEDLQDRLMQRQDELIQVEEELQQTVAELEDTKSKLAEMSEQKAALEDDLDVAKAKAQQLYKAEATVVAYKKKLEGIGMMNQQMEDLEGQAEKYLRQIMTLESEVKKSAALQKTVSAQEETIAKLEKTIADLSSNSNSAASDVADLKTRLSVAENARKQFEEELNELRMKHQHHTELTESDSTALAAVAQENAAVSQEQREKMMRLEIENQQLREQLEGQKPLSSDKSNATATETPFAVAVPAVSSEVVDALQAEVEKWKEAYQVKEQETLKISSDKDKLEAYTKRTLAKFQDKYLVALQECKAKLKEKQDKIESLEKRSQTERNAQKREERLLSSAIYELGLGIMQNKLKSSSLVPAATGVPSTNNA